MLITRPTLSTWPCMRVCLCAYVCLSRVVCCFCVHVHKHIYTSSWHIRLSAHICCIHTLRNLVSLRKITYFQAFLGPCMFFCGMHTHYTPKADRDPRALVTNYDVAQLGHIHAPSFDISHTHNLSSHSVSSRKRRRRAKQGTTQVRNCCIGICLLQLWDECTQYCEEQIYIIDRVTWSPTLIRPLRSAAPRGTTCTSIANQGLALFIAACWLSCGKTKACMAERS
jgi:hypothetical protein